MNNDDKPNAIETVGEVVDEYVKERVAQIKQHERAYTHDNPEHYRQEGKVECIDAMPDEMLRWLSTDGIRVLGQDLDIANPYVALKLVTLMMIGFCAGNAFKYRYRAGDKEGQPAERDEAKAQWYDAFALHLLDPEKHPDPRSR